MRLDGRIRALRPDLSWTRIRELIARGQVEVDGRIVRDAGQEIPDDAAIEIDPDRPALPYARLDLQRLYEDAEILVVDKPAGLLTVATEASQRNTEDTVLARVQTYARHLHGRRGYAGMLHRLDRDTSGALAVALSREAHAAGRALFGQHRFERRYLAIVSGVLGSHGGTIDAPISREYADGRRRLVRSEAEGRPAVTHFCVREEFRDASLVELRLETGRQHQIRLHLERLGHPLLGEQVYTGTGPPSRPKAATARSRRRSPETARAEADATAGSGAASRQMLHAWRLEFPHPIRGTVIRVEAPLPPDFERVLRRLRGR